MMINWKLKPFLQKYDMIYVLYWLNKWAMEILSPINAFLSPANKVSTKYNLYCDLCLINFSKYKYVDYAHILDAIIFVMKQIKLFSDSCMTERLL